MPVGTQYHVLLNSKGYILSNKNGKKWYQKKRAPTFVNKFGGGDSSYRDATYWQYFVQTNWRNGAKQLKFDDAGKFWKSQNVDTSQLEKLTLSKTLASAGQLASGVNVETIASWRNNITTLKNDANLKAYFRFEGNSTDEKAYYTPTDTAMSYGSSYGKFTQGASCSKTSYIQLSSKTYNTSTTSYTMAAWVNATYAAMNPAFGHSNVIGNVATNLGFSIESIDTSNFQVTAWGPTGAAVVFPTSNSASFGAWHHIAVVFTAGSTSVQGYIDGVSIGTVTLANGTATSVLYFGGDQVGYTTFPSFYVDDAVVFDRALSQSEVQVLYQNEVNVDAVTQSDSVGYGGTSTGKIYSWDSVTTWTEVFDCRKLTWFETTNNDTIKVGDEGGTERAGAQGFQLAKAQTVKAISVKLAKNAGTPGDITVRIETNGASVPSGTLADTNATGTITAFSDTGYVWYTVEFATAFSLAATTQYWIVLKTAAAANDNNYVWGAVTAGGYSSGTNATSADGGSTWSAGTKDQLFRVLGNATSVNCSLITKVGGTKKMLFGTGNPLGTTAGDARIYSYDGTTWALNYTFTGTAESVVSSLTEFTGDSKVYVGVGSKAEVYTTSDLSTYTVSKDIDTPDNPGYIYAMREYNSLLYAVGGSPEQIPSQYYDGFYYYYDLTTWRSLYPFDFTVLKSLEFYDAYLFAGTYHGQLYVYDTSSLNPLFNFKDDYDYSVSIHAMKYFDDKLYIGLYPQEATGETNVGVWRFDRRGLSNAHVVSGVTGYRCFAVVNGALLVGTGANGYVYKLSTSVYETQGWYQSSYYDANLPSVPKLYNSVVIRHEPIVSGQSIVVYYRFKESDAWTTLGTSSAVGDIEKTLTFPTGTTSNKITLKVELNTTDTSASPTLTEVVMQYSLYPARKWQWTMRLMAKDNLILLDKSTEARSATTIRSELDTLMDTETLYSFEDIDGVTYNVLVNDIDQNSWVVNQSDVLEDEIIINLLES